MKVRLEHSLLQEEWLTPKFQFHKGTIRTGEQLRSVTGLLEFQFHKGTIRTDASKKQILFFAISIP